jgi:hypothetical protein
MTFFFGVWCDLPAHVASHTIFTTTMEESSPPASPAKIFTSSPLVSSQSSEPPTDKLKVDEDDHSGVQSSKEQQTLSDVESHAELRDLSPDILPPSSPPPYSSSPCEVLSCGVVAESTITIEPNADPAIQVDEEQTLSLESTSPIKRKRSEENTVCPMFKG